MIDIKILHSGNESILASVAEDVFDYAVDPKLAAAFLSDPRHHIAVAIEDGAVVGFVSAIDYIHPDKPRELWINEVGVAPSHQRRGIGKALFDTILTHARALGCTAAWVLTDRANIAAMKLYTSAGATSSDQVMMSFSLSSSGS